MGHGEEGARMMDVRSKTDVLPPGGIPPAAGSPGRLQAVHSERTPSVGTVIRACLAALSFGAAAIHVGVIGDHFHEFWLYGAFFVVVAALQLSWGVLVLARPRRRAIVAGGIGSAAIAAVWLVSRTAGIPIGPGGGGREAVGVPDAVSTGFEVAIAVGVVLLVRTSLGRIPISRSLTLLSATVAWMAIGAGTAAAFVFVGSAEDDSPARRDGLGGVVRPHLVHVVLFAAALAAVIVYWSIDRRRMRTEGNAS
jgi:hypothetical protein